MKPCRLLKSNLVELEHHHVVDTQIHKATLLLYMKKCKAKGCDRTDIKAHGLCNMHYARLRANGTLVPKQRMDGYRLKHPELYKVWLGIRHRCKDDRPEVRSKYKDKGITVCKRWTGLYGFQHFVEDMGDKPSYERTPGGMPLWTIDRIDSNKGYSPENCRWANWRTQAGNRCICNEVPGVAWDNTHRYWTVSITINRKTRVKHFVNYEKAVQCRKNWEQKYPQIPEGT